MNASHRRRLAFLAPAAALGLALPMVLSGVADAATGTVARFGSTVAYNASSGSANTVTFALSLSNGHLVVSDSSGLLAGPGCTRLSATNADCGPLATVSGISASTGDLSDTVSLGVVKPSNVTTGTGNDTVNAKNGAYDQISCGDGTDTVHADSFDLVAPDCEVVTR